MRKKYIFQPPKWRPRSEAIVPPFSFSLCLSLCLSPSSLNRVFVLRRTDRGASFPPLVHPPPPHPRCRLLFLRPFEGEGRTSRLSLLHLFIGPLYYLQFGARSREGNFILVFCLLPYSAILSSSSTCCFLIFFFSLSLSLCSGRNQLPEVMLLSNIERIFRLAMK